MSEITIQFEYPVPDEQYHQTADQNKIGRIKYKGPAKKYLWINNTTNTIHSEYPDEIAAKLVYDGNLPMPGNTDCYLIEVDAKDNPEICSIFGGTSQQAIPDKEEDVPGQTRKHTSDAFPDPAHAYEMSEIVYDPIAKDFVKPYPWKKPFITWPERIAFRNVLLAVADKTLSDDLPTDLYNAVTAHKQYLRDVLELTGVDWTATIPTGGTGYAVGDVLLVQDPKYKNTTVVDEVKITVDAVDGDGAITGFTASNKRALYHPEAATYTECFFVTNGAGTGAKVTLTKIKQVDPWKTQWDSNPVKPDFVQDVDFVEARADDDNPDHLVDEIADPEMKRYFHDTSHELYIDVSDLLD